MKISKKTIKMVRYALIMEIDRLERQQVKNKNKIVNKIDGVVRKALEKALKEINTAFQKDTNEVSKRAK